MRRLAILVAVGGAVLGGLGSGCALDGDGTWGDENRSRWKIDDGLCPGLSGGCDMFVPVAAGADPHIDAEIPCCDPGRFDVVVTGPAQLEDTSVDRDDDRLDMDLRTTGAGEVTIALMEDDGSLFDRIRLDVREATEIECGVIRGGANWMMSNLTVTESTTEDIGTGSDRGDIELGCRLIDATGDRLLSARGIQWRVLETGDEVTIDNGGFDTAETTAEGARIYAHFRTTGDQAILEARFGELTQQINVTVE